MPAAQEIAGFESYEWKVFLARHSFMPVDPPSLATSSSHTGSRWDLQTCTFCKVIPDRQQNRSTAASIGVLIVVVLLG